MRITHEREKVLQMLRDMKCRVEETEDQLLKIYIPPDLDPQEIFRIASEGKTQIRHFVKSQTSLEDLFAEVVGVD
jgi:ABC-type uncharacterized transport system ATPase subunit